MHPLRSDLLDIERLTCALEQLAQRLAAEHEPYSEVFRGAAQPYLITDACGLVLEANAAAGRLLAPPLAGKPIFLAVAPASRRACRDALAQVVVGAKGWASWRAVFRGADGGECAAAVDLRKMASGRQCAWALRIGR